MLHGPQVETSFQTNGYDLYRRRNNKRCKNYYNNRNVEKSFKVDKSKVYNKFL